MKTNFLILLAAVAAGVLANSEASPEANVEANLEASPEANVETNIEADLDFEAELQGNGLVKRAACHKPSKCGVLWAGGCERYCLPNHKFSHMSDRGCGIFAKRCCCKKK